MNGHYNYKDNDNDYKGNDNDYKGNDNDNDKLKEQ